MQQPLHMVYLTSGRRQSALKTTAIRNAYEDLLSYLVKKAPCFIEIAGYRVIEWVHEAGQRG